MELVLHLIKYSIYYRNIFKDLKVIGLLLGLQMAYTKCQCFLCPWDSRDDEERYNLKDWHLLEEFFIKVCNVSLFDPTKVFTPIQIKLGFLKNLLKQWIEMAKNL